MYPKRKNMVDLESQYGVHQRSNREEFIKWFYIVSGHLLSKVHLGENSYYDYKEIFRKVFKREKVTSDDFPSQVLLALAMLGYITGMRGGYSYRQGSDRSHGYPFIIDKEKLLDWGEAAYDGYFMTISNTKVPVYVMTQTSAISFNEKGDKEEDRASWTQHTDWLSERQYQTISSIEVTKEGVIESSNWLFNFNDYKAYSSLSDKEKEKINKERNSYQELRDLSCHIVGGCKEDDYAGRFYHPICFMMKDHRHKYLRLDGERITEVDVSAAQPTFLGLYMYQKTGKMSEWLKHCLEGDFYEWIQHMTSTNEERATIKKWMMQYLYACYQPNMKKDSTKPHHPTYEWKKTNDPFLCFQQRLNRFLKEKEPAIYNKIEWHKRNPVYRDDKDNIKCYMDENGDKRKKKIGKGKWCSTLSYDLVKMEVEYIKKCIKALPKDEKFWTIHDCLCVKESRSQDVKTIMEEVSREMYGLTIKLKREICS